MRSLGTSPLAYLTIFGLIAAGISVVFFQYNAYIKADWDRLDELGTLGDAFGGLNAFFSGIGIAGIIVAIIMQSIELRNQRQELRENTNSLLLTSYLNALDSLRGCYAFEISRGHGGGDDEQTPELPTRLKYRLTLGKLEALVRHLEKNEKDLKQLDGAAIARSEHWFVTLKATLRIFQDEWARECARRYTKVRHRHADGTVTERIGDVRFHDLQQIVVKLNNHLILLLDEIEAGYAHDSGAQHVSQVQNLIQVIEERQREKKQQAQESKQQGVPLVDEEEQRRFETQCEELRKSLDRFAHEIEKSLETGELLRFHAP